ncbi:MAG: radical SAM protein [Nanoarchaeota archaeon]
MSLDDIIQHKKKGPVLLINPPSPFLLDERVFPPLCLADIGAVLENNGYHVDLLDLGFDVHNPRDWETQVAHVARKPYTAFCLTATSPQFMYAEQIRKIIRRERSDSHIVIGGAHPSLVSTLRRTKINEWMRKDPTLGGDQSRVHAMLAEFDPNISTLEQYDLIYEGDGESAVHQVVDLAEAKRIIALGNSKWFNAPRIQDLDTLGIPARHLFHMETYKYSIDNKHAMSVMTQRGCPFGCEFCSGRDSEMYRKIRMRGSDHVIRELRHMQQVHGADAFMFYDDEFNLDTNRTKQLCEAMIRLRKDEGILYSWRAFMKSEIMVKNPEIAMYMKDAGCVEVCTGVESGSTFILKHVIHKNTSPDLNLKARQIIKVTGMKYKSFTMVGHPGETEQDAMDTLEWIKAAHPDDFDVTVCTPYPGAPIYDRAQRHNGNIFVYDDSITRGGQPKRDDKGQIRPVRLYFEKPDYSKQVSFYKGVPGEYVSLVWTDALSQKRFVELREFIDAEAREYLGLSKIARPSGYDQSMGAPPARMFSTNSGNLL